jgi:TRAP-type C4-dicarboxylate transport system permease small subunit
VAREKVTSIREYVAENPFDALIQAVGFAVFHIMLLTASIRIINRFFHIPISLFWVGEITRTGLVVLALIAVPYLFVHELDISFLPVVEKLPERQFNTILVLRNALLIVLAGVMIWSSYLSYGLSGDITLPTVQWFPIRWMYALMGAAFVVMLLFVLVDIKNKIRSLVRLYRPGGDTDV